MKGKKLNTFKRLILLFLSAISLIFEILVYRYYWLTEFYNDVIKYIELFEKGHWVIYLIYGILLLFLVATYGGMKIGHLKNGEVIFSQIFATIVVNIITYLQISVMVREMFRPQPFLEMLFYQILGIFIWTIIAGRICKSIFPPLRMLLVYGSDCPNEILSKFLSRKDKYDIGKIISYDKGYEEVIQEITEGCGGREYEGIVLYELSRQERNDVLKYCYGKQIRVYIIPKITDVILKGSAELHLFDTPIFLTREYVMTIEQQIIKRCIDIIGSLLLVICTLPIMVITAICIKLYDGGPILYKQCRCTIGLKEFYILKFRSMKIDAEKDGIARLATKSDDRITFIGKFIRKVRIDELPQLFNILCGDMTFIGPRPERPEIIQQYVEIMPEFEYRTRVKAGLAGYAQIYGKYNTTPYDKLKLDLTYIEHYTIWMDLKLMLLTLKILFWPDSTEGVDESQLTALKQQKQKEADKAMNKKRR